MAKFTGPKGKIVRRFGQHLPGLTRKSAENRPYPPGQHGQARRRKRSDYGEQLREKQKVKRIYGIAERQFRGYYFRATRMKGVTGENLIQLLERRLDNTVYRMGFASDHAEARQLVRHGHLLINGRRLDIPSYLVRENDVVEVKEKSRKITRVTEALGAVERRGVPSWVAIDKDAFRGTVKALPTRADVTLPIREQLIVELYSK